MPVNATDYPRALIGYGSNPPNANWPSGARLALEFVLAYESLQRTFVSAAESMSPGIGSRTIIRDRTCN